MSEFIKKRDPFFKKEQLEEFNACETLQQYVSWHMRHTPWFDDSVNYILGKEDWEKKKSSELTQKN